MPVIELGHEGIADAAEVVWEGPDGVGKLVEFVYPVT